MRIRWFLSRSDARPAARREDVHARPADGSQADRGLFQLRAAVASVIEPLEGRTLLSSGPGDGGIDDDNGGTSGDGPDAPADVTGPVVRFDNIGDVTTA